MTMHGRRALAALLVTAASAVAADAAPAAKSEYVALLKPGEVFAPVDATGAGLEPLVDTDEVFPAASDDEKVRAELVFRKALND